MKRIILALMAFALALGANAALYLRDQGTPLMPPPGDARVTLSGQALHVPRALMRSNTQWAGGRLDQLEIAVAITDFSPLPPPNPKKPDAPMPDRLMLTFSATQSGQAGPADALQSLYARFLGTETWSTTSGLVMRRFRAGTPYEDREIYIGAGTNRLFIALCPKNAVQSMEPCTAKLRADTIDIEMRFDARYLPEWRRVSSQTLTFLAQWREKTGRE